MAKNDELKNTESDVKGAESKDSEQLKNTNSGDSEQSKSTESKDSEPPKSTESTDLKITDEETEKAKKRLEKRRKYNREYYAKLKAKAKNTNKNETDNNQTVLKVLNDKDKTKNKKTVSYSKVILGILALIVSVFLILLFVGSMNKNESAGSRESGFTIERD